MTQSEVMSTDDLRNKMYETLRRRGFVDGLKTQLRNRLVSELKDLGLGQSFPQQQVGTVGRGHLCQQVVNSLIADHLKFSNCNYTLSIFLPEAGISQEALLPLSDILQLLHVGSQSKLYKKLITNQNGKGLLWNVVSEVSHAHGNATIDSACQTDSSHSSISSLGEQMAKVDAHFSTLQDTQLLRAGAFEERILSFQRHLEERYRSELNIAMARFKENEVSRLQVLEREHCRKEIEKARKEMEHKYRAKFDALVERERHAVEQLQRQQEIAEQELFSQRQKMLADIEVLQQREVQVKRQQEIDYREKTLLEEKVKTREELAKRREESARSTELQLEQRIRDEVNKFKLEEQSRYVDRLTSVEFREARVKENERRLDEQLQDISNVKVELTDKRQRVNDLEAEMIRTRHELLSVQKQAELLSERTREMTDYQILKEDNAVLRRELDNAKMRISELMRDNIVERQKQEELLREMSVQAGKPTPEIALLRQQIDQLQSRHRTELALIEHERLQLQQRLDDEIGRNKELIMKCEQQTWQQKQFGMEAIDLRERLFDAHHALGSSIYRRKSDFDWSASLHDCSDVRPDGDNDHILKPSGERNRDLRGGSPTSHSQDQSYSSDIVQDTRNRLRRLENEADSLEKNYRDFQFRLTSIDPILGPSASHSVKLRSEHPATASHTVGSGKTAFISTKPVDSSNRSPHLQAVQSYGAGAHTSGKDTTGMAASGHSKTERYAVGIHNRPLVAGTSYATTTNESRHTAAAPVVTSQYTPNDANRVGATIWTDSHDGAAFEAIKRPSATALESPHYGLSKSNSSSAAGSPQHAVSDKSNSHRSADAPRSDPQLRVYSPAAELPQFTATRLQGSPLSAEFPQPVPSRVLHGSETVTHDTSKRGSASSNSGQSSANVVEPAVPIIEPTRISLDDAWKSTTLQTSAAADNDREKNAHEEEFERQRRQKEDERRRQLEEARLREQQELENLTKKQPGTSQRRDTTSPTSAKTSSSVDSLSGDEPAQPEVKVDPVLEKYMAIVKQQKENEKQQAKVGDARRKDKGASPVQTEDEVSISEAASESSRTIEKDDSW